MRKTGATQWTMAKLLTMILAVFLLVIIIYGVQNKGFGPLMDNIKGRYNEVLILLGFRDDGVPSCGDSFSEDIGDMNGEFFPCEDHCDFTLISPDNLLGFSNFSISGDGFVVKSKDGAKRSEDVVFKFDSVEAQRHKDAYDLLDAAVGEFLYSSLLSYGEFIEDMSFDSGRTLYWEYRGSWNKKIAYGYNGENWKEGRIENGEFVKEEEGYTKESDVLNSLYGAYKKEKGVSSWYIYDQEKHDVSPTFADIDERFFMSSDQFENRFNRDKNEWDERKSAQNLTLSNLKKFFKDSERVEFEDEMVSVNADFNKGVPIIYFLLSSNKGFGIYYDEDGSVLSYNDEISRVSDYVGLLDDGWEEFMKINDIYEYFKLRRCGV